MKSDEGIFHVVLRTEIKALNNLRTDAKRSQGNVLTLPVVVSLDTSIFKQNLINDRHCPKADKHH